MNGETGAHSAVSADQYHVRLRRWWWLDAPTARRGVYTMEDTWTQRLLARWFQPAVLLGAVVAWLLLGSNGWAVTRVFGATLVVLSIAERVYPQREDFKPTVRDTLIDVTFFYVFLGFFVSVFALQWFRVNLLPFLVRAGAAVGLPGLWPTQWPLLARVFVLWMGGEFIWYWIHRTQHAWPRLWLWTGHVVHHSPTKMTALVGTVNHPIEYFWVLAPQLIMAGLFGAHGSEMSGYTLLVAVQASAVHVNMALRPGIFGWLFATPAIHVRHHSNLVHESKSNFGCSMILWDRVFRTYEDSKQLYQVGIGRPLNTVEKMLVPFVRP